MTVQASGARLLLRSIPARAREAIFAVEHGGSVDATLQADGTCPVNARIPLEARPVNSRITAPTTRRSYGAVSA